MAKTTTLKQNSSTAGSIGFTDNIYQSYKVYIEGVQVPFENISITQGIGVLPTAVLSVPPQSGLMDIARYYQPKVHIFYEDRIAHAIDSSGTETDYNRLIFHGTITGTVYDKSVNPQTGNLYIQFICKHRNNVLNDFLIDYSSMLGEPTNLAQDVTLKAQLPNSVDSILEALWGISPDTDQTLYVDNKNEHADMRILPTKWLKYFDKLQGIPGVFVNMWNQLKRAGINADLQSIQDVFTKLYKPLMEDGIKFFDRFSGHPMLEKQVEDRRVQSCTSSGKDSNPALIPPGYNMVLMEAAQTSLVITQQVMKGYMQSMGEITNIYQLMNKAYTSMMYEIITLASPSETPVTESQANAAGAGATSSSPTIELTSCVETIVKPMMPFYFSPACNVILPHMYESINIHYDEESIPTRVVLMNQDVVYNNSPYGTIRYRAPNSVREAIAAKAGKTTPTLSSTTSFAQGAVGVYEQGRGVKAEFSSLPPWIAQFSAMLAPTLPASEAATSQSSADIDSLSAGWKSRYGEENSGMNPWAIEAGIQPQERMLFATADYMHTMALSGTKVGSLSGPFNPYVVPGYPMDILDPSPVLPSFHALCTSITHNISASGASTSIGFSAAMTYDELVNYYIPFIHPFLQLSLNLAADQTLVNKDDATGQTDRMVAANEFYKYTLGVSAISPCHLYDFDKKRMKAIRKNANGEFEEGNTGSFPTENGGEANPNLTFEGNLSLVFRPIESQSKIQSRFGLNFIDMTYSNYPPTAIKIKDNFLSDVKARLEIGASQYLDYTPL